MTRTAESTDEAGARAAPRRGIGVRLLGFILLFSSMVTLLLTALQLYLDYRRDVSAIEARLDEIETGYGRSIGAGLWNVDVEQLELQLNGILRLPDIRAVELREEAGGLQPPLALAVGSASGEGITREYPITYDNRGEVRKVGTLYVEATLNEVYRRLWEAGKVIIVSQGIKTFLVSLFILFIVHRVVTRHLSDIARFVGGFDLLRPQAPLRLQRPEHRSTDELDRVVEAFNGMSVYLHRAYADLERANRELEHGLSLRRSYEEKLERQAHYDGLTGLPNRVLMQERLRYALRLADRTGAGGALLCIDLDQFRNVNDTMGHGAGDELLKEAATRLTACMGDHDTLARMGGDEFAVILTDVELPDAVEHVGGRVLAAFAAPFRIAGRDHYVTASIGATLFPVDGNEPNRLLRNAELAMYKAKEAGRNRLQRFVEGTDVALAEQLALEEQLRGAVERGQLELHYQPIVGLDGGRIVGREALLRWRRDNGVLWAPDRFIPTAEDMGLIADFGRWVLSTACADLAADADDGLRVAVNVSPRQLQEAGFAAFVEKQLARHDLRPAQLELEITERVVMDDTPATEANLTALCALGVRLSIDDFGTGYSSLGYLQRYPFNTLKIDRSFVAAALTQASAGRLVETIIAMGHGLGLEIIAEGVESADQLAFLAAAGCELAQGYYFGRPAPRPPVGARQLASV